MAFIVQVLINLIQVKYQGISNSSNSPFDTRPIAFALMVHSLLLYCFLAYVANNHPSWVPTPYIPALRILAGLASLVSMVLLVSFLLQGGFHSLPYLLLLLLLLLYRFRSLPQKVHKWILRKKPLLRVARFLGLPCADGASLPVQGTVADVTMDGAQGLNCEIQS